MTAVEVDWSKVGSSEVVYQHFASRRSTVYGKKGVVSCTQPLAAQAGLEILIKGGNAGIYLVLVHPKLKFTKMPVKSRCCCCGFRSIERELNSLDF